MENKVLVWKTAADPVNVEIASDGSGDGLSVVPLSLTPEGYDGSISDTYLNYFRGIIAKNPGDEYLAMRSGQYEYLLVYGDLELNGKTFSGSGDYCRISLGSGYQGTTEVTYGSDILSFTESGQMIYSSLGNYPELREGGSYEALGLYLLIGLFGLYFVFRDILKTIFHR